jgi:BirA family biotin operon repressor/biotin-[acetyl-CoA-carboxylase] ligase
MEKSITLEPEFAGEGLVEFLFVRYKQLRAGKTEELEQEYLDRLYGLDQIDTFITDGKRFTGIIRGVNQFGELLVSAEGRERTFGFQEIKFASQVG